MRSESRITVYRTDGTSQHYDGPLIADSDRTPGRVLIYTKGGELVESYDSTTVARFEVGPIPDAD